MFQPLCPSNFFKYCTVIRNSVFSDMKNTFVHTGIPTHTFEVITARSWVQIWYGIAIFKVKKGHIGGSFSCLDILVSIYHSNILRSARNENVLEYSVFGTMRIKNVKALDLRCTKFGEFFREKFMSKMK